MKLVQGPHRQSSNDKKYRLGPRTGTSYELASERAEKIVLSIYLQTQGRDSLGCLCTSRGINPLLAAEE